MRYDSKTRYEAIAMVRGGASLRATGRALGVGAETARRWRAEDGVAFALGCEGGAIMRNRRGPQGPPGRLGLVQRLAIASGLDAGLAHASIAKGIGFSRPTVTREISRHAGAKGSYDPYAAQSRRCEGKVNEKGSVKPVQRSAPDSS